MDGEPAVSVVTHGDDQDGGSSVVADLDVYRGVEPFQGTDVDVNIDIPVVVHGDTAVDVVVVAARSLSVGGAELQERDGGRRLGRRRWVVMNRFIGFLLWEGVDVYGVCGATPGWDFCAYKSCSVRVIVPQSP